MAQSKYPNAKPFDIIRDIQDIRKAVKNLILNQPVSQVHNYIPNWTAATTNPSIGSGSIVGFYRRVNGLVIVTINLSIGSTTTLGSGRWALGLPFPVTANCGYTAPGIAQHGGSTYTSTAILSAGASNVFLQVGQASGNWDTTHPFAWTNGDTGTITATYETDN